MHRGAEQVSRIHLFWRFTLIRGPAIRNWSRYSTSFGRYKYTLAEARACSETSAFGAFDSATFTCFPSADMRGSPVRSVLSSTSGAHKPPSHRTSVQALGSTTTLTLHVEVTHGRHVISWWNEKVRSYIDSNLHHTIHIRDLSAVARRSPAHFSRKFKLAVGESPDAFLVRRRLERACHLMITSAASLSEIASSVGFSDQAHLCRLFRQAFGQSPANWRREREIPDGVTSRAGMDENIPSAR